MPTAETILVVEDDQEIVELIQTRFTREGFRVESANNGKDGLEKARAILPNLILLDLRMPDLGGLDVCRILKQETATKHIPVIMVTANNDEVDIVLGLEMGADDYVTKPFSLRELVARVRAVMRRGARPAPVPVQSTAEEIHVGNITVNFTSRDVLVGKNPVKLTPTEFQLLWTLACAPGRVLSRLELLEKISKVESGLLERNVDVHVMSLRKKLGDDGNTIVTVRGVGYKIRADVAASIPDAA